MAAGKGCIFTQLRHRRTRPCDPTSRWAQNTSRFTKLVTFRRSCKASCAVFGVCVFITPLFLDVRNPASRLSDPS